MPDEVDEISVEWEAMEEAIKAATPSRGTSQVQSLIFPKIKRWTKSKAVAWAKSHGMRSDKVDETSTSFRLRQKPPGAFKKHRTICLSPGRDAAQGQCRVAAVLGIKEAELPPSVEIVRNDQGEIVSMVADDPRAEELEKAMTVEEIAEKLFVGMSPEAVIETLGDPSGRDKYVSYHGGEERNSDTLLYGKGLRVHFESGALTGWSLQEGSSIIKSLDVKFAATDDSKHLVFGIVMEPDEVDTQGDITSADEIEKAAHRFMERSRVMGEGHKKAAKAMPVESYIAPQDFELGGQTVKAGSWVMASKVFDDDLWEAIKAGDFTGFSIGAYTRRVELEPTSDEGSA